MSKIAYIEKKFTKDSLSIIHKANRVIDEYQDEGLDLTLRQLYYQFVSRDIFPEKWFDDDAGTFNTQKNYKKLGDLISNARLAGHVDWLAIEDRTRNLKENYHNTDPGEAIADALDQFLLNKWDNQPFRPEVWIEKEALTGVISRICKSLDVPYFACKGYNSQSEMWRGAMRLHDHIENGQKPVIIHLGDHDPSGIDMTRDIDERNYLFTSKYTIDESIKVVRIALNYDQVEYYNPPPNPTKLTDTRAKSYIENYGLSSWELDALEPTVIRDLIESTIDEYTDHDLMEVTEEKQKEYIEIMQNISNNWETLQDKKD